MKIRCVGRSSVLVVRSRLFAGSLARVRLIARGAMLPSMGEKRANTCGRPTSNCVCVCENVRWHKNIRSLSLSCATWAAAIFHPLASPPFLCRAHCVCCYIVHILLRTILTPLSSAAVAGCTGAFFSPSQTMHANCAHSCNLRPCGLCVQAPTARKYKGAQ